MTAMVRVGAMVAGYLALAACAPQSAPPQSASPQLDALSSAPDAVTTVPPESTTPPPHNQPDATALTQPATLEAKRTEQGERSRIVGGENANPKVYPWIAAIGMRDAAGQVKSYCAGTLIARDLLITAAHCQVLEGDYAVLGRADLATTEGHVVKIVKVIPHRSFNSQTLDYDIALARLETPVDSITPVKLIDGCQTGTESEPAAPGARDCNEILRSVGTMSIAGWGRLGEYKYETPNFLQKADVKVSLQSTCVESYRSVSKVVTDNMFCAQGVNKAGQIADACKGDSGGPLVGLSLDKKSATIAGVVSKGQGCARTAFPGIYTHISRLRGWVDQCSKNPLPESC